MSFPKVDACIVGVGAGGATVAMRLAEAGLSVVAIEAGPHWDPLRDFVNDREVMRPKFAWGITNAVVYDGDPAEAILNTGGHTMWGVGGGTNHYACAVGRLHPTDFKTKSVDGIGVDWPVTYDDLVPSYLMAEKQLGVSTPYPDVDLPQMPRAAHPAHRLSYASQVIKQGYDKLGIFSHPGSLAINSRAYEGRPACNYCGFCTSGCMIRATGNTLVTHVPRAMKAGAQIRANCYAREITVDTAGRAKSIIYFDPEGHEQEQEAGVIILACFAVETPRLLLNSASSLFPNGLANSSGLVGKYIMAHLIAGAIGVFEQPLDSFRGFPYDNLVTYDFYNTDLKRGFARGYKIVTNGGDAPAAFANREPSLWGSELKRHAERYRHQYTVQTLGESLADASNTVTIDPLVKDTFGVPAARIRHRKSARDTQVFRHALATCKLVMEAAGAKTIYPMQNPDGHLMGTTRMGNDPKASVVNSYGQCHDVKNLFVATSSVFPTGGAVNPTLTIVALANRTADYIVAEGKKGRI